MGARECQISQALFMHTDSLEKGFKRHRHEVYEEDAWHVPK